jgi:hypothetical protein
MRRREDSQVSRESAAVNPIGGVKRNTSQLLGCGRVLTSKA